MVDKLEKQYLLCWGRVSERRLRTAYSASYTNRRERPCDKRYLLQLMITGENSAASREPSSLYGERFTTYKKAEPWIERNLQQTWNDNTYAQ